MKVVIDTNVFVSSFFSGKPREVINLWVNQYVTLCLSKDVLDEYLEVLARLNLDEDLLAELMAFFAKGHNLVFTRKTPIVSIVESDPDDNKFIECALALNAQFIITGDNHLLEIEEYNGIKIITPADFLSLKGWGSGDG